MKNIGSVKEDFNIEKRISITPETTQKLVRLGMNVFLEKNYGKHLGFDDQDYKKEGANIFEDKNEVYKNSEIFLKVNCPLKKEVNLFKNRSVLIGAFNPNFNKEIFIELKKKRNESFFIRFVT